MIEVDPALRTYVSEWTPPERQAAIRRCADLVRRISLLLVDSQLPEGALGDLESLLTTARDAAERAESKSGGREDADEPPGSEVHPWIGRSNPIAPPMQFHLEGALLVGLVQCSEIHSGRLPRVHGGVVAGLFDAIVATRGALAGRPVTASLSIDYRRPVPINRPLRMEAAVQRIEGRKCHVEARMHHEHMLLAEASALLLGPRS